MHWLLKYRVGLVVNLMIFSLIVILSLQWKQSPFGLEGVNFTRLIHLSAHIILIPFFTLYLPLRIIKSRHSSSQKAYLYGMLLCVLSGFVSATYTHSISNPGGFLIKLDGGVIAKSDPRYNAQDPRENFIDISFSPDVTGT